MYAFACRHGLSYTTYTFSNLELGKPVIANGEFSLSVAVTVTNTGAVAGSEVVQVYVSMSETSEVTHPPRLLRAFQKVSDLAPGATRTVRLALDRLAVSYYDAGIGRWVIERGTYGVSVGPSSDVLPLRATFVVDEGVEWTGL